MIQPSTAIWNNMPQLEMFLLLTDSVMCTLCCCYQSRLAVVVGSVFSFSFWCFRSFCIFATQWLNCVTRSGNMCIESKRILHITQLYGGAQSTYTRDRLSQSAESMHSIRYKYTENISPSSSIHAEYGTDTYLVRLRTHSVLCRYAHRFKPSFCVFFYCYSFCILLFLFN